MKDQTRNNGGEGQAVWVGCTDRCAGDCKQEAGKESITCTGIKLSGFDSSVTRRRVQEFYFLNELRILKFLILASVKH
jgi:hypothetical protein